MSNDNNIYTIIGIILLAIIITVIIVIILNQQENSQPLPLAKYNEICVVNAADSTTVSTCDTGLACIKNNTTSITGVCKQILGTSCIDTVECVPNTFCNSGICSTTQNGGLNQSPPCNIGLMNINNICKIVSGGNCSITADCGVYGQQCVVTNVGNPAVKTCTVPKPTGELCIYNQDCASLFCDPTTNTCSGQQNNDGNLGSLCVYYAANNTYINCQEIYKCQRDLANVINNTTSNGVCLPPVITWPANNTNNICSSDTNSCIPPSICYNGQCVFPINNPLSCSPTDSTGGCLTGFTCDNKTTCLPTTGYPGNGTNWNIVQWVRSVNGQMGWWNPLTSVPSPGINPSFSSYTSISDNIFIYCPDTSQTDISNDFYYQSQFYIIRNGTLSNLTINFNGNTNLVIYLIKFIPSNNNIKIRALIYDINGGWYCAPATLNFNTLTINSPTKFPTYQSLKITDFNMDCRGDVGRWMYCVNNTDYYITTCPIDGSTNDYLIDINKATNINNLPVPITGPVFDLQFITYANLTEYSIDQLVVDNGNSIYLYQTDAKFGSFDISKMYVTTAPISNNNLEIMFIQIHNGLLSLYLVEGENTVIMPVQINNKTLINMSVLDANLSNQNPNIYILTSTAS
jgi:hypothetical protein